MHSSKSVSDLRKLFQNDRKSTKAPEAASNDKDSLTSVDSGPSKGLFHRRPSKMVIEFVRQRKSMRSKNARCLTEKDDDSKMGSVRKSIDFFESKIQDTDVNSNKSMVQAVNKKVQNVEENRVPETEPHDALNDSIVNGDNYDDYDYDLKSTRHEALKQMRSFEEISDHIALNGLTNDEEGETKFEEYLKKRVDSVANLADDIIEPPVETHNFVVKSEVIVPVDKKYYIIDELIKTEEDYINSLKFTVDEYMMHLAEENQFFEKLCPEIFCNIAEICLKSELFLLDIIEYRHNYTEIGIMFVKHESLLESYPIYVKNKHNSERILQHPEVHKVVLARQRKIKDALGLESLLLKPVQRLSKYQLLMQQLSKELKKEQLNSDQADNAASLIITYLNRADTYVLLQTISEGNLTYEDTGDRLFMESCNLIAPAKEHTVLAVFQKKIVFMWVDKDNPNKYIFRNSLEMHQILWENCGAADMICIYDFKKKNPKFRIKFRNNIARHKCMSEIQKLVMIQAEQIKDEIVTEYTDIVQKVIATKTENNKKADGALNSSNDTDSEDPSEYDALIEDPNVAIEMYELVRRLIKSEQNFINSLTYIVDEYLTHLWKVFVHPDFQKLTKNLLVIQQCTVTFTNELSNKKTAIATGHMLLENHDAMLNSYVNYVDNIKDFVELLEAKSYKRLIDEREKAVNDTIGLTQRLLGVVKHLSTYENFAQALLKRVQDEKQTTARVKEMLLLIVSYITKVESIITIHSFNQYLKYKNLGNLLAKDNCKLTFPIRENVILFLFEQAVIIAVPEHKRSSENKILYSLRTKSLTIKVGKNIVLQDFTKKGSEYRITFKTDCMKEACAKNIRSLLWRQLQEEKDKKGNIPVKNPDDL